MVHLPAPAPAPYDLFDVVCDFRRTHVCVWFCDCSSSFLCFIAVSVVLDVRTSVFGSVAFFLVFRMFRFIIVSFRVCFIFVRSSTSVSV